MVILNINVGPELKALTESVQMILERCIVEHHNLYQKLQKYPTDQEMIYKLRELQKKIHEHGHEQAKLLVRVRAEVKANEKALQTNGIKQACAERANNINTALQSSGRVRKQHIVSRATSAPVSPNNSLDISSGSNSPEPVFLPTSRDQLSEEAFLKYFELCTHAVHDEMQTKRVERKRRSTANSEFFYGSKGWDFPKRKRASYLVSNCSPPNTRQSAKNRAKAEKAATPPSKENSRGSSPIEGTKLYIPNLPNGLIIERVNPNRASPDSKLCVVCRSTGSLVVCESCTNGFHVACHNRPLTEPPRKCPKCLSNQDVRTVGALTVPSGMTVFVSTDVSEKLQEKQTLLDQNEVLLTELNKLQDQHDQLTISLKDQKVAQDKLIVNQQSTEEKIQDILDFVKKIKLPTSTTIEKT